jgi:DNA polymerase-3 subunit delta'
VSFERVKDQDVAIATLKMAIRKNRLAHAYLFEGPDGVGKKLTAEAFAKAVNCEKGGDDSCDTCWSCLRIGELTHPDVTLIEPVKAGRAIHVDTMQELIERSSLKPYRAKYRVAILVDAERMNDAAANKFLKTLEEPPGNSLFILVSHSPEQLPATIVSRSADYRACSGARPRGAS